MMAVAGAAACLVGLWFSLTTLRGTPDRIARIRTLLDQQAELAALEQSVGGGAAREAFDRLATPHLARVQDVAAAMLPDIRLEIQEQEARPLTGGWRLRSVRVVGDRVPVAPALAMVAALESERPPWRLVSITLDPDPTSPDRARFEFRLTGLHRELL